MRPTAGAYNTGMCWPLGGGIGKSDICTRSVSRHLCHSLQDRRIVALAFCSTHSSRPTSSTSVRPYSESDVPDPLSAARAFTPHEPYPPWSRSGANRARIQDSRLTSQTDKVFTRGSRLGTVTSRSYSDTHLDIASQIRPAQVRMYAVRSHG